MNRAIIIFLAAHYSTLGLFLALSIVRGEWLHAFAGLVFLASFAVMHYIKRIYGQTIGMLCVELAVREAERQDMEAQIQDMFDEMDGFYDDDDNRLFHDVDTDELN